MAIEQSDPRPVRPTQAAAFLLLLQISNFGKSLDSISCHPLKRFFGQIGFKGVSFEWRRLASLFTVIGRLRRETYCSPINLTGIPDTDCRPQYVLHSTRDGNG